MVNILNKFYSDFKDFEYRFVQDNKAVRFDFDEKTQLLQFDCIVSVSSLYLSNN